jgi:3-methyladenine DNA glycosylase AlkD
MNPPSVHGELLALRNPEQAAVAQRFFKTAPGEYGAGDRFLGIRVPVLRRLARNHQGLSLKQIRELLSSPWHEERLLALLILVRQYQRATPIEQEAIYRLYLTSTDHINNWDLVDCSAEHIVGPHQRERDRTPLRRLVSSARVWDRRIAVMATFHYIRRGEFGETLGLARLLFGDRHDLIHKAVGWMLREIGKRDRGVEERFLCRHAWQMPRTMLRYAIEHFPPQLRRRYMRAESALPSPGAGRRLQALQ